MIAAKNVSHRFDDVAALTQISVEPRTSAVTALVGPNAAGKSTLLRCLAGAIKPQEGDVLLEGRPIRGVAAATRARRVAFVPQKPSLSADFTVREAVELGRYALETSSLRVDEALRRLELSGLAERPFHALSAGQQQRVVIARALAQVDIDGALLLDEPTSAMDVRHTLDLVALMRELAGSGATVVMSVHDLAMAAECADDVWMLDAGRVVASGAAREVMTVDRLEAVFGARFEWVQDRLVTSRA